MSNQVSETIAPDALKILTAEPFNYSAAVSLLRASGRLTGKSPKKADAIEMLNSFFVETELEADTAPASEAVTDSGYVDANGNPIYLAGDEALVCDRNNDAQVLKTYTLERFEAAKGFLTLTSEWNKKTTKSAKTTKIKTEKAPRVQTTFEMVQKLALVAQEQGYDEAAEQFEKTPTYCKRATRAYQIYCQSEVIKELFDAHKISWAAIHKLGGHNPASPKTPMAYIEQKAKALAA